MSVTRGRIAVVIPALNEVEHIGSLLEQQIVDCSEEVGTIVVCDGGSTDGTQDIVSQLARRDHRILLLANPFRIQSAGVNLAVEAVGDQYDTFVRLDAHAGYPRNYVNRCASELLSRSAQSVVVRLRTVPPQRGLGAAIAAALNSPWGTGGSLHRIGGESGYVDHGHHAAFDRETFVRLGGYDTSFVANEDGEYDARLRRASGRIWFESSLEIDYHPRRTVSGLAKQYFRYGVGRAQNIAKHGSYRLRQLLPPLVVSGVTLPLPLTLVWPLAGLPMALYLLAVLAIAAGAALRDRSGDLLLMGVVLPVLHFSWSAGFMYSIVPSVLRQRSLR